MNKFRGQLIRYTLVGIVSNVAIYFIYLLLAYFGIEPKISMTATYVTGAFIGFVGNGKWTFENYEGSFRTIFRYALAHAVGYGLNFAMLYTLVDRFNFPHQIVQAIAIIIVAGYLFLIFKFYVFRKISIAEM